MLTDIEADSVMLSAEFLPALKEKLPSQIMPHRSSLEYPPNNPAPCRIEETMVK